MKGLSPRTRGKPRTKPAGRLIPRPIPANTGETSAARSGHWPATAYPREHGGNACEAIEQQLVKGLSPRTRGKLEGQAARIDAPGPIPANTGETGSGNDPTFRVGAYPREHGGN